MKLPFFTTGHSTRSLDEFAGLLAEQGVAHLVDIRTIPRSRTNPQFNRDTLPAALAALRDHVRRSGVVAVPSAHRRRLPDRRR